MVDLSTNYLGINLKNPLVSASSPLSKSLDHVRHLEDSGISAIVMYSLFEEQLINESKALDFYLTRGTESFAEALTYFPDLDHYNVGGEEYLELINKLKKSVEIPIIGSLNGYSVGGWLDYAKKIEQAGADALELNIYYLPTDLETTSQEVEDAYIDLVSNVADGINIPLSIKICPFFTSLPNFAANLVKKGVKGLVLFNRFIQPDLDIEMLEVDPIIKLSTSNELLLPLRWVAILYGRIQADLALTSGVHTGIDVIKSIMAGAKVVMLASELLEKGPERIGVLLEEINGWMERYEYKSIHQMLGSMSQKAVKDPTAFERANYMKALISYDNMLP